LEGPNEINNWPVTYNGVTGLQGALNLQQDIYTAVQASPVLKGIAVDYFTGYDAGSIGVGPNPATTAGLANFDNQHPYPNGGEAPYLAVGRAGALVNENPATGPAVYTETGYSSNGGTGGAVNADVQAKYTLDLLLDDAKNGVAQTYLYDLLDAYAPGSAQGDDGFGLFDYTNAPKEAATGIHDLTTILADNGANATTFTPTVVNYSITNLPTTGNSLALQKSSGATDIVVWNEPPIWNATNGTEMTAATTNVTVNLGATYQSVEVFDPLIGTTPIKTLSNVSSVTLGLTDHPLIVEMEPPTGGTPTPPPTPVATLSITGVSAASAALGAPITISGTGFGTTPGTVVIGGVRMTVTSWSNTQIATSIPNFTGLVPGKYVFDVTTASGASIVSGMPYFTIVAGAPTSPPTPPPPVTIPPVPNEKLSITAVSAPSAALGAPITISGTGFGTTPGTVVIGGVRMSVTSWSDTQIATSIPNFTGLVPGEYNFDVTTASGASIVSGIPYFTIVAGAPKTTVETTAASLLVSTTSALNTQTASITVTPSGGNPTTIAANAAGSFNVSGDTIVLPASGVATVGAGSEAGTIQFIGLSQISFTEGAANTVVTANAGTNTWTAGAGTLEVRGGGGSDTYVYHQGNSRLTVDDFSAAKGDVLKVDSLLLASLTSVKDGTGGTLLTFASGGGIDLKGVATNVAASIHWS
jgi:hypothetical protein